MPKRHDFNDTNEIADALHAVSFSRKLRLAAASVMMVVLVGAVFVAPNITELASLSEFLDVKRLFTTESIVDVKEPATSGSLEPAPAVLVTDEANAANESALEFEEDELGFEPEINADPSFDAFPAVDLPPIETYDEPSTDERSETPPVPVYEEPAEREFEPIRKAARNEKPRTFARAANIVDVQDAFVPNTFSEAAKRAISSNARESRFDLANAARAAAQQRSIAPVDYTDATDAASRVATAEYQDSYHSAYAPTASPEALKESELQAGLKAAEVPISELTAAEAQSVDAAQAELRRQGLLGARIERWDERNFRATGMTRGVEGAFFNEAFGPTPDEAAKALLQKALAPNAQGRALRSGF